MREIADTDVADLQLDPVAAAEVRAIRAGAP
jgi:hypothetical protein